MITVTANGLRLAGRSLGLSEETRRANERVVEYVERQLELNPDDVQTLLSGASALVELGERDRGLKWASRVLEASTDDALLLYNIGCVFSLAGDLEKAMDALEKSYAAGLADPDWMNNDSDLDPLRGFPRFDALMQQMDAETPSG